MAAGGEPVGAGRRLGKAGHARPQALGAAAAASCAAAKSTGSRTEAAKARCYEGLVSRTLAPAIQRDGHASASKTATGSR
jgi:hypothetical protein